MARQAGLVDDGTFYFFPQRIGKCTLWYGKKRSFFPFHALMGPDWPCMLITYFLILCPSYFFITGPAAEVGTALVILTALSTAFACCAFSAAACSDPGIVFKDPSGIVLAGSQHLHVSLNSSSDSKTSKNSPPSSSSVSMNTNSNHISTPYTALNSPLPTSEGKGVISLLEQQHPSSSSSDQSKSHGSRVSEEGLSEERDDSLRHRRDQGKEGDEEEGGSYQQHHHHTHYVEEFEGDDEEEGRASSQDPILPSSSSSSSSEHAPSALEAFKQKAEEKKRNRKRKTPDREEYQNKHFSHLERHNKKGFPYTRKGQRIYNDDGSIRTVECSKCDMERPITATHCYECGLCVNDLDHHCPWTGKCIAENNLRPFYWFLGALAFHMTFLFIAFMYYAVSNSRKD